MRASLNGLKVIRSDAFVIPYGSEFIAYPFDDDSTFSLKINVRLHGDIEKQHQRLYADIEQGKNGVIVIIDSFYSGIELALANRIPIIFASDENKDQIKGNFSFRFLGPLESFTTIFMFTILGAAY